MASSKIIFIILGTLSLISAKSLNLGDQALLEENIGDNDDEFAKNPMESTGPLEEKPKDIKQVDIEGESSYDPFLSSSVEDFVSKEQTHPGDDLIHNEDNKPIILDEDDQVDDSEERPYPGHYGGEHSNSRGDEEGNQYNFFLMVILLVLALCLVALAVASAAPSASKLALSLQKSLQSKSRVNILVSFVSGTRGVLETVEVQTFASRTAQVQSVYDALTSHATDSQKNVIALLNSPSFFAIKVESLWISNQVYVQGVGQYLIDTLAAQDDVARIEEEEIVYLEEQTVADVQFESRTPGVLAEWGVAKIQSEEAWAVGGNGTGAIAGVIDTGARYTHTTLNSNYRGGTHSWYNPYTKTQQPGDGHGHGTHCTGIIAGTKGIGVAPGAKWISCKGVNDQASGTNAALLSCGQFMLCPTTYKGQNADCSLAPHVVSNSWGRGVGSSWYDATANAWKAAGIIPVFALGNSGSSCRTSISPGDSAAVIGVGATTTTDAIADFSSRGPANAGHLKPDISAPGNEIVSAGIGSDNARTTMSGTSRACPHVAGLVALLKARNPNASYAEIKRVLQSSADHPLTSGGQMCYGVRDTQFPNYTFGHGRINALKAVQAFAKAN